MSRWRDALLAIACGALIACGSSDSREEAPAEVPAIAEAGPASGPIEDDASEQPVEAPEQPAPGPEDGEDPAPLPAAREQAPAIEDLAAAVSELEAAVAAGEGVRRLSQLERWCDAQPARHELHVLRGRLLGHFERLDDAVAAFDRAVSLEERCAWAYHGRAVCRRLRGQFAEAVADLERARAIESSPRFISELAWLTHLQGDSAKALELIDQAIAGEAERAEYHRARGEMLRKLGRRPDAIAAAERAIALDPERPETYDFLIQLLLDDVEADGAQAAIDKAVRALRDLARRIKDPDRRAVVLRRADALDELAARARRRQATKDPEAHLASKDSAVRKRALQVLAVDPKERHTRFFLIGLVDPSSGVRVEAVRGLRKLGGEVATAALIKALRLDESEVVRAAIADALGAIGKSALAPMLVVALEAEVEPYPIELIDRALRKLTKADPGVEVDYDDVEGSRAKLTAAWRAWLAKRSD